MRVAFENLADKQILLQTSLKLIYRSKHFYNNFDVGINGFSYTLLDHLGLHSELRLTRHIFCRLSSLFRYIYNKWHSITYEQKII